ncbi:hypothetical protein M8J75_005132 [Diaphorina citri]|nr:hypothetical protein M8J75_005132 [Diaphorina citri]
MIVNLFKSKLEIHDFRPYDILHFKLVGPSKTIVIVTLYSPELVHHILKSSGKLKGMGIFLERDLSAEDRKIKQSLLLHKKSLSGQGKRVVFKNFKTLLVDGQEYSLDTLNSLYPPPASSISQKNSVSLSNNATTPTIVTDVNHDETFAGKRTGEELELAESMSTKRSNVLREPMLKASNFRNRSGENMET